MTGRAGRRDGAPAAAAARRLATGALVLLAAGIALGGPAAARAQGRPARPQGAAPAGARGGAAGGDSVRALSKDRQVFQWTPRTP